MERIYTIKDCRVKVSYGTQLVRITNDDGLLRLLAQSLEPGTDQLVAQIKKDHYDLTGSELHITDRSLAVEIWGHVYFEYFILAVNRRLPLKLMNGFAKAVSKRCRIIDAGGKERDNNRKFWNLLAPFKKLLARMLRGKISHR